MASALCGPHLALWAKKMGYKVDQLPEPIEPIQFPYQVKDRAEFDRLRKEYDRAVKRGHPTGGVRTHRIWLNSTGKKARKSEWKMLWHAAFSLYGNGMDPDCDCDQCRVVKRRPLD